MKTCSKCKTEKELSEFHKDTTKALGVAGQCKACKSSKSNRSSRDTLFEKGLKKCNRCKLVLPVSVYHKNSRGYKGLRGMCQDCCKETNRGPQQKWKASEAGKFSNFKRMCRQAGSVDFTREDWDAARLVVSCEACGASGVMHIDHCHDTGKIRGTLCQRCNTAEGLAGGIEGLKKLISYLEKHEERTNDGN